MCFHLISAKVCIQWKDTISVRKKVRGFCDVKHAHENGGLPAKILDILTTWNVKHAPTRCVHGNCTWTSILYPNMELSRMEGGCLVYKWLPMRDYYITISWNNISQGSTLGFSVFHQKLHHNIKTMLSDFPCFIMSTPNPRRSVIIARTKRRNSALLMRAQQQKSSVCTVFFRVSTNDDTNSE